MTSDELIVKLNDLADALEKDNPGIATYVERIHENLRQYPELVHVLEPAQVKILVSGIEKYSTTKLTQAKPKSKKKDIVDLDSLFEE